MPYVLPGLGLSLLILPPLFHSYIASNLLRVVPLISSTVSLQWAVDEYQFLSSWTDLSDASTAATTGTGDSDIDRTLSGWFRLWGKKGTRVLMTSFPSSIGFGLANVLSLHNNPLSLDITNARTLYALGSVFALGHMVYGRKALGLLKEIREGGEDKTSVKSLKDWLAMHTLRSFTTDTWAVVCFAGALMIELNTRRI